MSQTTDACRHCGVVLPKAKGFLLDHQRLCLGPGADGRPLGVIKDCPACMAQITSQTPYSAGAMVKHWNTKHTDQPKISDTFTLRHIRARFQRHLLPSTDMSSYWGNFYSQVTSLELDPELLALSKEWGVSNMLAMRSILGQVQLYRADFSGFFGGAVPLEFGMHVSHMTPGIIAGTLVDLARFRPLSTGPQATQTQARGAILSAKQARCCNVIMLQGIYGASSGSLAYHAICGINNGRATGPKPARLAHEDLWQQEGLTQKLRKWKSGGYFAVIAEMVCASTGVPIDPVAWRNLVGACEQAGIYLIVDEAQTAIRCGAPFAHLLPQYAGHRPSLVLFGKGMAVAGVAAYADGATLHRLGYTTETLADRVRLTFDEKYTEAMPKTQLLEAHAVLRRAKREDWPGRAVRISASLRNVLAGLDGGTQVLGIAALIFFPVAAAAKSCVPAASAGPKLRRWFPPLDSGMDNPDTIVSLFGPGSHTIRRELAELAGGVAHVACVICHMTFSGNEDIVDCETCFCTLCSECWGAARERHMSGDCLGLVD